MASMLPASSPASTSRASPSMTRKSLMWTATVSRQEVPVA